MLEGNKYPLNTIRFWMNWINKIGLKALPGFVLFAGWLCVAGCSNSNDSPGPGREPASSTRPINPATSQKNHPLSTVTDFKLDHKPYNVLLITIDTLRVDRLGIYSRKYAKTPNIDRFAQKSIVFTRAFSHNPVTLPAHTNILTGTTPLYHGISDNTGFRLHDRFLTLAEFLKSKNYRTAAFIGAFPLDSRFGLDQGFDLYDDHYGTHNNLEFFFVERKAEEVIKPTLAWLKQQPADTRWFSWVHLFDPHQPYLPPSPFRQEYPNDLYSGEVAYIDSALQLVFAYLEDSGHMKDTVVIITGDHGEALGEKGELTHSYFAYNNTIHIPLICFFPGAPAGFVHENACHIDIFPTICDALGMTPPAHLQGQSLLPLVNGSRRQQPAIYFESLTPYLNRGWAPLRGFIRENLKFIDLPIVELYNIEVDKDENNNLAANHPPNEEITTGNIKPVTLTQLQRDLAKLKRDLKGKEAVERSEQVDPEVRNKLKSLGYLSSSRTQKPDKFTGADDLKTLLPLQNRMLNGVGKYQEGKLTEAVQDLESVIKESPGFSLVYRHLATIYQETGRIDKALEILEKGLKSNPGDVNLMSKLGIIMAEANQPGKAIELLEYCIKIESFDPEIYNFLGVAYYKKVNFPAALANYRKALELDQNYASVFNNIGSLYLVVYMKNKDEESYRLALENFDRALQIDPRLFAAYNGRGAAFKFKHQNDEAIKNWLKTIELNPHFVDAYFNLAVTYLEKGDKSSALTWLTACRDRLGTRLSPGATERLERLIKEAHR